MRLVGMESIFAVLAAAARPEELLLRLELESKSSKMNGGFPKAMEKKNRWPARWRAGTLYRGQVPRERLHPCFRLCVRKSECVV